MSNNQHSATVGIICAMQEEIRDISQLISANKVVELGSRYYQLGNYNGLATVACLSGMGKVAAASTVTTLIQHFGVSAIIFTGVAGAIADKLEIGDVVVATSLIQHDFDASPVMRFKRFEIPLTGKTHFESDQDLSATALKAAQAFLRTDSKYAHAQAIAGIIASGDQFISDTKIAAQLLIDIPGLLAVEMEGAAVAQVCHDWKIPFAIIRSISDTADHAAKVDFLSFIEQSAAPLSAGVIKALLSSAELKNILKGAK